MPLSSGEFFERVVDNDLEVVRRGLAESPSLVAARDRLLGSTPLHYAAHRGYGPIVRVLLDAGADVHALEEVSGTIPLHWAAEAGHTSVARMLLARGSDLDAIDTWFRLPPLGWAAVVIWAPQFHEDKPATATALLEAGARVDAFSAVVLGRTDELRQIVVADPGALARRLGFVGAEMQPLHVAVSRKLGSVVPLLLDLGADIDARTSLGMTALALALEDGDQDTASLLRARGAAEDAASAMAEHKLAALGARLDGQPDRRLAQALLFAAVGAGYTAAIDLLVGRGADPNARMKQLVGEVPCDLAPLHIAARRGHAATVSALIAAGAHPDAGNEDHLPAPLHLAAAEGRIEAAGALLSAGADPAARERLYDSTPAGWAAYGGHEELADLLARAERERVLH